MRIRLLVERVYDTQDPDHGDYFRGLNAEQAVNEAKRLFNEDLDHITADSARVIVE